MKKSYHKKVQFLLILLYVGFIPAVVHAQPVVPQTQSITPQIALETFLDTIVSMDFPVTDQAQHESLKQKAGHFLDLDSMGKESIAVHWEEVNPEQQKHFLELLWDLVEESGYPRAKDFLKGAETQYDKPKENGKGVSIRSVSKKEGQAIDAEVIYSLYRNGEEWKIYDIVLDGVSMIEDLSYQFNKMIEDSSFDGLLGRMEEKLTELRSDEIV